MPEHYTKNTESATAWCNKCNRFTEHRVDNCRRGPCMEHETPIKPKEPEQAKQESLFGDERA